MADEMSMDEITILSATSNELYAYIKPESVDKEWPSEMVCNELQYVFDEEWALPTQMGAGWVKAARYIAQP